MKKIRILQADVLSKNIGGIEVYLMEQFCNIDRDKMQYDFLTPYGREMAFYDEIIAKGGKVHHKNWFGKGSRKNPWTYYNWYRFLKDNSYDIVVLNAMSLLNIDSIIFAKLLNVPVRILHSHNAYDEKSTKSFFRDSLIKYNEKNIMKFATHLFACSKSAGEWMFGNEKFTIIRNAIQIEKFQYDAIKREEIKEKLHLKDKFVVGHVGRFDYQKNHEFLMDIFYEIYKKKNNAVLLMIGLDVVPEIAKKIQDKVESLGLKDSVYFLGMRKDVHDIMQAMDVFVFPSLYEGLGIVLIEAQASGLKCFVSQETITNEVAITDLIHFISLRKSADLWADEILKNSEYQRKNTTDLIRKAGYDAKDSAKWVEKFYCSLVNNHELQIRNK